MEVCTQRAVITTVFNALIGWSFREFLGAERFEQCYAYRRCSCQLELFLSVGQRKVSAKSANLGEKLTDSVPSYPFVKKSKKKKKKKKENLNWAIHAVKKTRELDEQYGRPSLLRNVTNRATLHDCPKLSKRQQWFGQKGLQHCNGERLGC